MKLLAPVKAGKHGRSHQKAVSQSAAVSSMQELVNRLNSMQPLEQPPDGSQALKDGSTSTLLQQDLAMKSHQLLPAIHTAAHVQTEDRREHQM